jgi:purine-binding chemotaxis protein CheW
MPRKKQHDVVAPDADTTADIAADTSVDDAQPDAETDTTDDSGLESPACEWVEQVVAFHLAGQRYALPIERVQEIQHIVAFSEVPSGGAAVVGMVNLRGNVIPSIDLRVLVGLPTIEYGLETPMIICHASGELVAVLVDGVEDVIELPPGCLQDSPAMHALSSKMLGVARLESGLVYVLDLDLLLGGRPYAAGVS